MNDLVMLRSDSVVDAIFRSPSRHYTGTSSSPEARSSRNARHASRRRSQAAPKPAAAKPAAQPPRRRRSRRRRPTDTRPSIPVVKQPAAAGAPTPSTRKPTLG